jgi:hypothetical protein
MSAGIENTFDVDALADDLFDAASEALADRTPALQAMGEMEVRRLAAVLAEIGSKLATGEIDPERAKAMANIHQLTVRSVLRSVEGLSLLATDQVMSAVTRVAAGVANRIVGFKLL